MSKYRNHLPQLGNDLFLTDGGLETTLVFHEGMDLPCFAAFDLLKDEAGLGILRRYFDSYPDFRNSTLCRANFRGGRHDNPLNVCFRG